MADEPLSIFLSCGVPDNALQEAFLAAVETHLKAHGCDPQTVGRSKFRLRQPVEAARDLIGACDGAVVIAFERTRILDGVDRPNGAEAAAIKPVPESHPTIWNQMEAAMAYAQRVPILTLVQTGLKRQGMLSTRFEWVALEADLTPTLLLGDEFRQMFDDWLELVRAGRDPAANSALQEPAASPPLDVTELGVGQLLGSLKPKQLYAVFSALALAFAAVAGAGYWVGQHMDGRETPAKVAGR